MGRSFDINGKAVELKAERRISTHFDALFHIGPYSRPYL